MKDHYRRITARRREQDLRAALDRLDRKHPEALRRLADDLGMKLVEDHFNRQTPEHLQRMRRAAQEQAEEPERWDGGML